MLPFIFPVSEGWADGKAGAGSPLHPAEHQRGVHIMPVASQASVENTLCSGCVGSRSGC